MYVQIAYPTGESKAIGEVSSHRNAGQRVDMFKFSIGMTILPFKEVLPIYFLTN